MAPLAPPIAPPWGHKPDQQANFGLKLRNRPSRECWYTKRFDTGPHVLLPPGECIYNARILQMFLDLLLVKTPPQSVEFTRWHCPSNIYSGDT